MAVAAGRSVAPVEGRGCCVTGTPNNTRSEPTTFSDPCGPKCWTPVACPECGRDLPPRGRDVPIGQYVGDCCEMYRYSSFNHRHLWTKAEAE